jgi:hypothetical protein
VLSLEQLLPLDEEELLEPPPSSSLQPARQGRAKREQAASETKSEVRADMAFS